MPVLINRGIACRLIFPQRFSMAATNNITYHNPASELPQYSKSFPVTSHPPTRSNTSATSSTGPIFSQDRSASLGIGLQVPTRRSTITSGFKYPKVLATYGINKAMWKAFTRDVEHYGEMTGSQWKTVVLSAAGVHILSGFFLGILAIIPAATTGHFMRKYREQENFAVSQLTGGLEECAKTWNALYFNAHGLAVGIEAPEDEIPLGAYDASKGPTGLGSETTGLWTNEKRRRRAAKKGRITIVPFDVEQGVTEELPKDL